MSSFKRSQRKYVKKAYRVRNWREYEAGLRERGSLTVWIALCDSKLANWDAPGLKNKKPGRQRKYSDHAIETADSHPDCRGLLILIVALHTTPIVRQGY